jgi:hypothetical protein
VLVLVIAAACAPVVRGPSKITEAEVRAMLARVEEASKGEDVKAIMSFIANDAEISLTARGPLGSTSRTMGREDYERELKLGMSLTENYNFRTNIRSITISPDGMSAVVEADIFEVVELFGVKATSITKEVSIVQRRDGRIKYVKISAESEIQMSPPAEDERATPIPESI